MPASSTTSSGAVSDVSSASPFLSGVTPVELQGLLDTHDTQTLPNGVRLSRSSYQDEQNMGRLGRDLKQGLTGYPPGVQQFEQKVNGMQAQLGTLPPGEHEAYAGALATLDVAFRDSTDAGTRQRAGQQLSLLDSALRERSTSAGNDPVQRALGVFNSPVGAGYLTQAGDQRNLNGLTQLRDQFVAASTPASRQRYFSQAADLKNDLQHRIATAIDQHTKQEDGKWAEANAEVDRLLHEAEGVTGDPGKRHELIGRQLFSTNPGSGRDDLADRRLLAFTQRMQDDPALHDRLVDWSVEAGRKLNGYGVDAPKGYLDILNNLPPAGPDYVRDLADQYNAVLKDASHKDDSITPRARGEKLADQILEGTARFLLGMTPLAPITAAFDAHSSLSENARLGIDLSSGLLGLVAGEGAAAFSERLAAEGVGVAEAASREHLPGPHTPLDEKVPIPGASSVQPHNAGATGIQGEGPQGTAAPQGFVADPAVAEASQRINGTRSSLPDDYAVQPAPAALKPAPGQQGVLADNDGHYYITSGGKTYPARFDKDNGTWRVWQADNAYRPQYPVRLDAQGNWQMHDDVGLKGGNPGGSTSNHDNMANRDRLGGVVQKSPTGNDPGSYPGSVGIVNDLLKHLGINLSDQSAEYIIANVRRVDAGELFHAGASASEVWTFARDVADPNLPMKDRASAALGMVINGILGPTYIAQFDLENYHFGRNQTADLRKAMQMYIQFDGHA
ncbi:hypothetical protein AYM40_05660 [Paraburkholderia phytofirmans OLGA172]|uniref:Uncharacterized protein n=1 Tax=Paraburkholderia phytofirmans OLGA172 TaxID=1417228 RepID=A0A160FJ34_9BURK|nr:hypothetical protein [Paraburkholderia phytofirmans]ANB71916.1 hypothetical protein AYM40_05660 [Paraburkholderia phytofirmans OLGA172]